MPYHRQTLDDLREDLKRSWESTPFWSDDEATRYLNHSLRFWNLLTGYWRKKVLVAASGDAYLAVPGTITFGLQVVYGLSGRPLQPSGLADFDYGRPSWETEAAGGGGTIPTEPQLWAPVGLTMLAIWPYPAVGKSLLIDGIANTPILSAPGDFVDADDFAITAIEHFALNVACFKRGLQSVQATNLFFRDFLEDAANTNQRLKRTSFYRKFMGKDAERLIRPLLEAPPQGQQ